MCLSDIGGCFSSPCLRGTCEPEDNGGFSCDCPTGYSGTTCGERLIESGGIKYYIFEEKLSWENARSECLGKNLIMTSIIDKPAHDLLRGLFP